VPHPMEYSCGAKSHCEFLHAECMDAYRRAISLDNKARIPYKEAANVSIRGIHFNKIRALFETNSGRHTALSA
jgi:hypothetical protein